LILPSQDKWTSVKTTREILSSEFKVKTLNKTTQQSCAVAFRQIAFAETCRFPADPVVRIQEIWQKNSSETT